MIATKLALGLTASLPGFLLLVFLADTLIGLSGSGATYASAVEVGYAGWLGHRLYQDFYGH